MYLITWHPKTSATTEAGNPAIAVQLSALMKCPVCEAERLQATNQLVIQTHDDVIAFHIKQSTNLEILADWLTQTMWICDQCGVSSRLPKAEHDKLILEVKKLITHEWVINQIRVRNIEMADTPLSKYSRDVLI